MAGDHDLNPLDLVEELEPLSPDERQKRLDLLLLSPELRRAVEKCLRFAAGTEGFLERAPAPLWDGLTSGPSMEAAGALEAEDNATGPSATPHVPGYDV